MKKAPDPGSGTLILGKDFLLTFAHILALSGHLVHWGNIFTADGTTIGQKEIRIRSDRHHFAGSGSESISTNSKAKSLRP